MSEKLSSNNGDSVANAWESYQADATWLEAQRDKAEAAGDQATVDKANAGIAFDRAVQQSLLNEYGSTQEQREAARKEVEETGAVVQELFPGKESNETIETVSMEQTQSPEAQAQSHPYTKTFTGEGGLVETITANTEEELQRKIKEYQDNIVHRRA